jgi:hypothetical protein
MQCNLVTTKVSAEDIASLLRVKGKGNAGNTEQHNAAV